MSGQFADLPVEVWPADAPAEAASWPLAEFLVDGDPKGPRYPGATVQLDVKDGHRLQVRLINEGQELLDKPSVYQFICDDSGALVSGGLREDSSTENKMGSLKWRFALIPASDGSLVFRVHGSDTGVMLLLIPFHASATTWARYAPSQLVP